MVAILWVWLSLVWHSKILKCSSADLKTPKNPIFGGFLVRNGNFSNYMPFLMLEHVLNLTERLSYEFECNWSHTVKIQGVLVQTWKPQKPIFWNFWHETQFFIAINLTLFLLLLHLLVSNGGLFFKSELYWSNTVKIRSVLVQTWQPPQKPFFMFFFGP